MNGNDYTRVATGEYLKTLKVGDTLWNSRGGGHRMDNDRWYPISTFLHSKLKRGNFIVYDFWTPPPPINFVHCSQMYNIEIIGHVAAALGPLAILALVFGL